MGLLIERNFYRDLPGPPSLLVMSTHSTSFIPWGFDEDFRARVAGRFMSLRDLEAQASSGFAEVAMRCGVAAFVGSFGEPPDLDSADAMIAFYEGLLSGKGVSVADGSPTAFP